MKYLNDWKIFETKLTEFIHEFGKSKKISSQTKDNFIKPLIPKILLIQFKHWVEKKLSPQYYKDNVSLTKYVSFSKLGWDAVCFEIKFSSNIFGEMGKKIYLKFDINNTLHTRSYLIDDHVIANFDDVLKNISISEPSLFKEEFFETIYQSIVEIFVSINLKNVNSFLLNNRLSKKMKTSFDKAFVSQKELYPEIYKRIINELKLDSQRLNQIRTHLPLLYKEIKSLQNPENQWSTDLQADAGEYGL